MISREFERKGDRPLQNFLKLLEMKWSGIIEEQVASQISKSETSFLSVYHNHCGALQRYGPTVDGRGSARFQASV